MSCAGTTASGSDVDTSTPGTHTLRVTAWNDNLATTARLLNPAPRPFVFARGHATAKRAKTLQITVKPNVEVHAIKPNARGRQLVAGHTYRVTLRVWVSYTPHGGRQRNIGYYHVLLP